MSTQNRITRMINHYLYILVNVFIILGILLPMNPSPAYAIDAPLPIYPEDDAETTSVSDSPLGVPSFSWSKVAGATGYRLQVDSEIGFNSPIVLDIVTANNSYTPVSTSGLFKDGDWYWRVRVEKPTPVSEWSPVMHFIKTWATSINKPSLIAPADAATVAFFESPTFSWSPVLGAAKYRFQISTDEGFSTTIVSIDTLKTETQPNNRYGNGSYFWRVIPMDAANHLGTISDVHSFSLAFGTTAMNLVPTLYEPQDETYPTFTPTFHWSAVEGAGNYHLEYTTAENCVFSSNDPKIDTKQTSYTPTDTFPNDVRYCWHVRADSGSAIGEWSDTWHFQKKWYLQPQLLTPTNLYQQTLFPVYSWTPVPGASRYKIDIDIEAGFTPPICESFITANTTYASQKVDCLREGFYYWRVTPIDGGGELGLTSAVGEYHVNGSSTTPQNIYPMYYYPTDPQVLNPAEDRTVPYPIFMWHRVITSLTGGSIANAYRLQVDTNQSFNSANLWQYDTENTSVTPTEVDNFSPNVGQDYFWRVCYLDQMGGTCQSGWSQIWKARFNPALALPATDQGVPELLRPAVGQDVVEATPLLEWYPLQNAVKYQVEINRDRNFASQGILETVDIPAYSPTLSLAQRILGRTDYGTFYWRVRAYVGSQWSNWSAVWRFQVASQSEWRFLRSLGDPSNRLVIGNDAGADADSTYDLTSLTAAQQGGYPAYWFLGFNANLSGPDMTYVLYIDLDRVDGSGAPSSPPSPRNYQVTTITAHQPEYAIYVDKIGGVINAQNTWVYKWNGSGQGWGTGQALSDIGGVVYAAENFVELQILNAAIGMSQVTGSASIILFSINPATHKVMDSVPSDPNAPSTSEYSELSRFSAVSERMNLIAPPSTSTGDPSTIPSILPFFWDWPTGSTPSNPFMGSLLEVHRDPLYTSLATQFTIVNNTESYFNENNVTLLKDITGDNIYYWRILPIYRLPPTYTTPINGVWTGGWSFRRVGLIAQNLQTSVTYATPTFSWDMAEGAETYRLQVSTDPNFGTFAINIITPLNIFTPKDTLAQGNYYWRVQVNRYSGIVNEWSEVKQLNLALPSPTGLTPNGSSVHYAPSFCWTPLVSLYNNEPVLTAWKYRLQVSQDANFSVIYDSIETVNSCWTPIMGYDDGTYFWHVAMIDGSGRAGNYSPAATFTKQYPITILKSPIGAISETPTFIWEPVNGASAYVFQVSKVPAFSPTYDAVTTINTHYTPLKVYDMNTTYYWRVAIRDINGRQGPFTDAIIIGGPPGNGINTFLPLVVR